MLQLITPLILTRDELPNIRRTLDRLGWARRILVIDSGSTDGTLDVLRDYPQVEVVPHPFADFASQCNFGLRQVLTPWVLSLDADYELSDALVDELRSLAPPENVAGYRVRFVYRVIGRRLRGSLYPPRTVLYRREAAHYRQCGHAHRVAVAGDVLSLEAVIYHDDRKPLARWFASQQRYAQDEAEYLLARCGAPLGWADRVRVMAWPAPFLVLFHALFVKGCVFDGWPGWFYGLQRLLAETMLALAIIDRRLRAVQANAPAPDRKAEPTELADSGEKSRRMP